MKMDNYKDKLLEVKRVLNLFKANYSEGCIKITKQESELHARVKAQVAHYLKSNNYKVWSEPTFKSGGRADLVAIHPNSMSFVFEILVSESEKIIKIIPYQLSK